MLTVTRSGMVHVADPEGTDGNEPAAGAGAGIAPTAGGCAALAPAASLAASNGWGGAESSSSSRSRRCAVSSVWFLISRTRLLTRMPSLATQSMSSGSLPFQTLPSRAMYLPFFILGTPEWCSATTSH